MADQRQVRELHLKYPTWGAVQIAKRLGCQSAYVRATATRQGITLPGSRTMKPAKPETLIQLGRAARDAGLTVADIENLKSSRGRVVDMALRIRNLEAPLVQL